jgi:signal transduction histidine kinase
VNLRSLHLRLLIAFALVLVPAWALFAALAVGGARAYFEELTQRQNAPLASNLVAEAAAKGDDVLSDDVVDMLAMANPGVEIYVLDVDGRVMAPPVGVELTNATVELAPIERFVATTGDGTLRPLPIRGTDPRGPRPVVFSAAPLDDGSGYLYVVLTDAPRSTLAGSIGGSATLGIVVGGGALGLLVAIGAGALVFALLTRRLRAVADGVRAYDPKRPEVLTVRAPARPAGDEVDDVASGVGALMERVRDQVAELAAVDAARRELVTNVSHDLRTPLTALHAALEASTLADHDPAQRAWLLDTASRHAQRLGRLVERLFEYSTLDEANPPLERETFPLDELVDDVVQKHLPRAEGLGLDLAVVGAAGVDGDPSVDGAATLARAAILAGAPSPAGAPSIARAPMRIAIHADIGLVERALSNVLDNALRCTPAGGRVRVGVAREGAHAVVTVADTGSGIDPEALPRIFDRFYRTDRGRAGEGSGLGLAIVQRIVALHGGEVGATSELGVGTTVRLAFPLDAAP